MPDSFALCTAYWVLSTSVSFRNLSSDPIELLVTPDQAGWRLDVFLAHHFPNYSRVHLRRVITAGGVRVGDRGGKPSYRLVPGQRVSIVLPEIPREAPQPEAIPLEILYDDDWLAAINKPPGMVVHPARGHWSGTLASAVQHHFGGKLSTAGGPTRPGIVHRLDRDTTGVMVVAKTQSALRKLKEQFHEREVRKQYVALVWGEPEPLCGRIETLVGRHPHDRKRMSARVLSGRRAVTHYATVERLGPATLVRLRIETGRTHQIRVHMAHIGHPVVGDAVYGRARKDPLPLAPARQMLHAERLAFAHPRTGEELEFEAPWPDDFRALIQALRVTGA